MTRCFRTLGRGSSFQCSSASRKFLNETRRVRGQRRPARFSALQRAENSSIAPDCASTTQIECVSVLFSEPKIPQSMSAFARSAVRSSFSALQRAENSSIRRVRTAVAKRFDVSVLFSEPKIPQWARRVLVARQRERFQCSSASRKFLNRYGHHGNLPTSGFQCSSASRKFLNLLFYFYAVL